MFNANATCAIVVGWARNCNVLCRMDFTVPRPFYTNYIGVGINLCTDTPSVGWGGGDCARRRLEGRLRARRRLRGEAEGANARGGVLEGGHRAAAFWETRGAREAA